MAKKKWTNKFAAEPRTFENGDPVLILRPNIWSGHNGEVVGFKEGLYHVRVPLQKPTKLTTHFSVEAPGSELESYL